MSTVDPNAVAQREIKIMLGDMAMELAFARGQLAAAQARIAALEAEQSEAKPNGKGKDRKDARHGKEGEPARPA